MSVSDERLRELIHDVCGSSGIYSVAVNEELNQALRELQRRRELSGPMAPIARVTVVDDYGKLKITRPFLFAPGLPPGEHNLYPEPPQREPTGPLPEGRE